MTLKDVEFTAEHGKHKKELNFR